MFAENVKLQTHMQHIRTNLRDSTIRVRLMLNGVGLLLYLLSGFYLAWRGYQVMPLWLSAPAYALAFAFIAILAPVFALTFDQGQEKRPVLTVMAYIGFYWMAFYVYALMLMLSFDLLRLLNQALQGRLILLLPVFLRPDMRTATSLVGPLALMVLITGTVMARSPVVRTYAVKAEKKLEMTRPLRIVFISDLHVGSLVSTANLQILADRVIAQNPDLVLLGGDLIDNSLQFIERGSFISQMRRIRAPLGVFAVLGNHELVNTSAADMRKFLAQAGIRLLQDETVNFGSFSLVGRDEHQTHYSGIMERMLPEMLLESVDCKKPVILMQHQPADLDYLARLGADLALAGHTHRGQLFPLNLVLRHSFSQAGRYQKRSRMHSLISDGYGTWGPPVRVGSRSEIVRIELSGS